MVTHLVLNRFFNSCEPVINEFLAYNQGGVQLVVVWHMMQEIRQCVSQWLHSMKPCICLELVSQFLPYFQLIHLMIDDMLEHGDEQYHWHWQISQILLGEGWAIIWDYCHWESMCDKNHLSICWPDVELTTNVSGYLEYASDQTEHDPHKFFAKDIVGIAKRELEQLVDF